ncbi:conserved Plasmodium protein, unknown function [Plasmodium vivax]|uniref:Uncharacterized protein n=3 Tax=Plasmodium vivax TaxID=5855 RepID=A0A0J9TXE6_PLAVI|nr:hypothetical protein PVBG_02865 [Plasmodium vivax Brazil I]KNA00122.1 hypothetical protein PVNG_02118 [Plasmodium vivax North Korean]CAG9478979.1 unnamed protein product [Plasmodium vivax]CAI7720061.1 conserved Plasmodium protein, unknown function [Plasmodium vivax]SCO72306.1 conserved Plasmodium protein, unknown function [Plasmodium vivax]
MERANELIHHGGRGDHPDERFKKKKRKKKKIRKNAFLFFLFLFLSGLVCLGPSTFFTSAKGININDPNGVNPPRNDRQLSEDNQKKKKKKGQDESDEFNKNQTNKSENAERGYLDLFNKNDGSDYKLNFMDGASLVNHTDIVKNGTFIFDAVNYLLKKLKEGPANAGTADMHTLRPGKDAVSANEIKRLILIKLLKCVAALILLYIVIRLTFTFIRRLINLIIRFIFKIIKLCCCGGR